MEDILEFNTSFRLKRRLRLRHTERDEVRVRASLCGFASVFIIISRVGRP